MFEFEKRKPFFRMCEHGFECVCFEISKSIIGSTVVGNFARVTVEDNETSSLSNEIIKIRSEVTGSYSIRYMYRYY
jgi:hypothetical protein